MGRGRWIRNALLWSAWVGAVGCGSTAKPEASAEASTERVTPSTPDTPSPSGESPPPATSEPAPTPSPDPPPADSTPPAPVARCSPTGAGPYWLQEGEVVQVSLHCGTGYTGDGLRFTVSPLPTGAVLDEASGVLTWTPGKTQAAVYPLTITERSTGETGALKIGVADNFLAPGNVRDLNPDTYTEEYGLPVIHLSFDGELTAGGYRPAQIVYRGHHYTLQAKYRGATSSSYPKRNYTFKFADDDRFNEPTLGGGFQDEKTVVLITSFNDNSYMRSRLSFDLWNRMSSDHIPIRTYSAVLYVNGRFKGLFTVGDHVDDHLLKRQGLSKDGELFKAVDADANFSRTDHLGAAKTALEQGFEKSEGLPESGPGAFSDLNALTAFINDSSDETFRSQWASQVNTQDYEDWWIFNTAILGTDSDSKNAYHYFDPVKRAPWRFIPWDLDATFGQVWDTHRISSSLLPDFAGHNRLFARMLADPTIATPLRERYRTLLQGPLSKQAVLALIDGYEREVHAVALRDEAQWMTAYRQFDFWKDRTDFTTHEQEVAYLRQWVDERWTLLEGHLP